MTKKELLAAAQQKANAIVKEALRDATGELNANASTAFQKGKRLRSCTAWVLETKSFYILKSYKTIIAVISKDNGNTYDALRMVYGYTATSAGHVAKFAHDYGKSYGERITAR